MDLWTSAIAHRLPAEAVAIDDAYAEHQRYYKDAMRFDRSACRIGVDGSHSDVLRLHQQTVTYHSLALRCRPDRAHYYVGPIMQPCTLFTELSIAVDAVRETITVNLHVSGPDTETVWEHAQGVRAYFAGVIPLAPFPTFPADVMCMMPLSARAAELAVAALDKYVSLYSCGLSSKCKILQ